MAYILKDSGRLFMFRQNGSSPHTVLPAPAPANGRPPPAPAPTYCRSRLNKLRYRLQPTVKSSSRKGRRAHLAHTPERTASPSDCAGNSRIPPPTDALVHRKGNEGTNNCPI